MMKPSNTRPTLLEQFQHIIQTDIKTLSDDEKNEVRPTIAEILGRCGVKLTETAIAKGQRYEYDVIRSCIATILQDGYNLKATSPSAFPALKEAQKLTCFKDLIRECVENSPFGVRVFKIKDLQRQRSAIARSKTLHALRQNVKAMLGPLKLYREAEELRATIKADTTAKSYMSEITEILKELKEKDAVIADQRRVIDATMTLYDPSADRREKLMNIEHYKVTHKCSDIAVAAAFGISQSTIKRLRREFSQTSGTQTFVVTAAQTVRAANNSNAEEAEPEFVEDLELF